MSFIPVDKMKKLREAAKNGDERAKNILRMQLERKDYTSDLDAYFAPAPEPVVEEKVEEKVEETLPSVTNPRLREFLLANGVKEGDEDFEDAVNDYYNEFPNERPAPAADADAKVAQVAETEAIEPVNAQEEMGMTKDMAQGIIELISKCDQTLLTVMQNEEIDDTSKKGAMTTLQEIKQSLFDLAEKIKKIKQSLDKNGGTL